jgi:3-dehydroquinate synthase
MTAGQGGGIVELPVTVPQRSLDYCVRVGAGLLDSLPDQLREDCPKARRVVMVSDENVMPLHGARVVALLETGGFEVLTLVVPAGEATKCPTRLLELIEAMIAGQVGRDDLVLALGGGVVGDLAGLAAALFMRGIDFVQCPTSLLAQVDASVGGKVAIDLAAGKNLLGAFHFPRAVLIDPTVLSTLPAREVGCGLAEMLKHGALFSERHFDEVVESGDLIHGCDVATITRMVSASVALKAACVSGDPLERATESGGRAVLNLGHTVGHAIELVSDFDVKHGEAVALGLVACARLSERHFAADGPEGELAADGAVGLERRIVAALQRLRLPVDLDTWLVEGRRQEIERALAADKKRSFDHVSYIALRGLGSPVLLSLRPSEIVALLRPPSRD